MFKNVINKKLEEDNVYKIDNQYVITGKGEKWNEARNEIEDLYSQWIGACEMLGQSEDEILSRISKAQIYKETGDLTNYYFYDKRGIIGEPFTIKSNDVEGYTDLLLLLMFISSKLEGDAGNQLRQFVNTEYKSLEGF